jgi:hypothetical protein
MYMYSTAQDGIGLTDQTFANSEKVVNRTQVIVAIIMNRCKLCEINNKDLT